MSILFEGPGSRMDGEWTGGRPLLCTKCGADRNLALHSIAALAPPSDGFVEVSYSCRTCSLHYLHRADVTAVAAVLHGVRSSEDVLAFGGQYVHCGRPMQKTGSELRRLSAPAFTDQAMENALDVYLTTQVLHCPCGFQMEVPE
ncbi:hypothetical protein QFZ70_000430 [Arthrobacter sp. V1I9]|nr:hypothetical protein [Arthrobacter sp. V1I9]